MLSRHLSLGVSLMNRQAPAGIERETTVLILCMKWVGSNLFKKTARAPRQTFAYSLQFRQQIGTIIFRLMQAYKAMAISHRSQYSLVGTKKDVAASVGNRVGSARVSLTFCYRARIPSTSN